MLPVDKPVGLEKMWGCQTLITLSTPPVAMMFARAQKSKQLTPFGIPTPLGSLDKKKIFNKK